MGEEGRLTASVVLPQFLLFVDVVKDALQRAFLCWRRIALNSPFFGRQWPGTSINPAAAEISSLKESNCEAAMLKNKALATTLGT